ncbi:bifunctional phosphoglucose/phosphomannose isomerase [Methanonatronarchaeum sp. AMET-Sl]|uniref:bifunctional phosphoglucose/phosphomannose isomerase n=1 Tax=Methanonatronarchaeum sp. AMET-Sl TaxID=3037654 RepID=UPI00244E58C1|nr:bifunctional phosphoglucose/phosphomannose isomerase [Methanonatronarchaeum sp. AMET-Sl]WGI17078.1 bifunctional phosphoglucose/phosphomannose isomerase [Methanonatronarchaeum sp. AMET-Sl]
MLSREQIEQYDSEDMLKELEMFPDMCLKAYRDCELEVDLSNTKNIIVTGMGGSAIGGYMLKQLLRDISPIPIHINRDYDLPKFVDKETLLLTVSYSGNTKETLSSFKDGLKKGCKILCITSNGKLNKMAQKNKIKSYQPPKGLQPRAAFPYLFLPLLKTLQNSGLIEKNKIDDTINTLNQIKQKNKPENPIKKNTAKKIAKNLNNSIPVIYGYRNMEPVAYRWKCQINENSKKFSVFNRFPELNHNEVVGWSDPNTKNMSVCIIREQNEPKKANKLIKATKNTFSNAKQINEITAPGETPLTRMLTGVYIGDYVSIYLATLNKVNPTPVKPITQIKNNLKKMEEKRNE